MVVLGVAVCNATTQSLLSVFGLLFFDTLEEMGAETTGAAVISNSMVAITNFSGMVTGPVLRHFSYRQVAMAGGVLVALGMFLTGLATRMWHFVITYSIFVGLGLGLLSPSTFVAVNAYFSRARGRAVGLSQAGTGLGQMLMPHAVRFLLDEYSFRGAVLILSGVALHALAGAALFHPLRWHARRAPAPPAGGGDKKEDEDEEEEEEEQAEGRRKDAGAPETGVGAAAAAEREPLAPKEASGGRDRRAGQKTRRSSLCDVAAIGEHHLPVMSSRGSLATGKSKEALGAFNEKDYVALERGRGRGACGRAWRRVARALDLDLLAEAPVVALLAGLAAVYSAGVNFNMLFPFFLATSARLPRAQVALCMSLMAGFDIASRLALPPLTDRLRVPARRTFLAGALVLAAARSLVALQESLAGLLATSAVCGFARGATTVNHNLAVSESVATDKLPGALGLYMVIKGVSIIALGLFVGWLRDSTGSYTLCMHFLSLFVVLPMLVWLAETWVHARRRRHRSRRRPPPSPPPPPYEAPASLPLSLSPPPPPPLSPSESSTPLSPSQPVTVPVDTPSLLDER